MVLWCPPPYIRLFVSISADAITWLGIGEGGTRGAFLVLPIERDVPRLAQLRVSKGSISLGVGLPQVKQVCSASSFRYVPRHRYFRGRLLLCLAMVSENVRAAIPQLSSDIMPSLGPVSATVGQVCRGKRQLRTGPQILL
jgi:hypothetical protein